MQYLPVGKDTSVYDDIAAPTGAGECLGFAGEATNSKHPSSVPGALDSGVREAVRIHRIIKQKAHASVGESEFYGPSDAQRWTAYYSSPVLEYKGQDVTGAYI